MTTRSLLAAAGLFVSVCVAAGQPPGTPPVVPTVPPGVVPSAPFIIPTPAPGDGPNVPPLTVPTPPPLPPAKTIEQLLQELEAVQGQKAQLEKQEQELKAAVRKKLEEIEKQIQKFGVGPAGEKLTEPTRVGRIMVFGFTKKDEKTVVDTLEKAGLHPGKVLPYPALEETRVKLEKSGFKGAEVLAVPDTQGSSFTDIHVKAGPGGIR